MNITKENPNKNLEKLIDSINNIDTYYEFSDDNSIFLKNQSIVDSLKSSVDESIYNELTEKGKFNFSRYLNG